MASRLSQFLPIEREEDDHGPALSSSNGLVVLSSRCKPAARLRCDPNNGELYLTRVELSAWQGIDLPRQWDNPDREPDPWPEAQFAGLGGRVREAPLVWENCLGHLHSPVTR